MTVGDEICRLTTPQGQSSTQVVCYLSSVWNGLETSELLPIVIMDLWSAVQSAAYYGAQLLPISVPHIDSIAGCQESGLQTSSCQLQEGQTDVITLRGDNFAQGGEVWQLWWGPYLKLTTYPPSPTPTSFVIPLNASDAQLSGLGRLAALDQSNTSIYVLLRKGELVSNVVAVTLAPIYLNISGLQGCSSVSTFQVSDCVPGSSAVYLDATNIYPPLSITVADEPCTGVQVLPGYVQCLLAAPQSFLPDVPYDMLVTQGLNTYTLPQAVAFTSRPVIQSITSSVCAPDFLNPTSALLNCMAGDAITLIGAFFAPPETLAVLVISGTINASCINPTVLSN